MEKMSYSLIDTNLFLDTRGRLFEKIAGNLCLVKNKFVDAEERYVKKEIEKTRSVAE
jgi:hypothetical protein